jgi:type II secretory ATPase GspE/PulE/Tfp pilus assembly ATPase PilB-like protein
MYSKFEWPVPPYYEQPPQGELAGHEAAALDFLDGRKLTGQLTRFLPTSGIIEFVPDKERSNIDVPLAEIEQLRLTRALILSQRVDTAELERRGQISKPSEKQSFHVELHNGTEITGETTGFEAHEAGLFLYVLNGDDTVMRTFVPECSIKTRRIGPLIGESLVEQNILSDGDIGKALLRQRTRRDLKLGEFLTEQKVISLDQLHSALDRLRAMPVMRLGEALTELHVITEEQLTEALELQKKERKKPLGEVLLDLGYLSKEQLYQVMSQKLGIPAVDLSKFRIDPAVLKALPDDLVRKYLVVPLCYDEGALVVAMSNPLDPTPIERVRFLTQGRAMPVMAAADDILQVINTYYGGLVPEHKVEDIADKLMSEVAIENDALEEPIKENDNTLVKLVNKMVLDAHTAGASDIHIETNPGKANVVVRFRRDGVMSEYVRLPYNFRSAIVSRLKIMASLDISERRRSQDGRINFAQFGPARLELRVVTVPTQDGLEDLVMRLLVMGEPLPISKLGLRAPLQLELKDLLTKPHGLILAVGPTGSGKTTTLHSLISVINVPGMKIWTAENPIEITQAGLRQVQVNAKIGWGFPTVMRAFLRADPDVIMVGEMRDQETANIAVEASLTGHLVFSTLHTNSAPETVVRLLDMGIDPFSFCDSLLGVLGQRLARRLCERCRATRTASTQEIKELADEYCYDTALEPREIIADWKKRFGTKLALHDAKGCTYCHNTGYHGRIGLHELLVVSPSIREDMLRRANARELRTAAIAQGMRTLKQDGIEKCLAGLTDIHEVRAAAS